jgi:transcription antitermination factor NusG
MSEEIKSHLFAIRTTGGQEKVVMRLLEAKANANQINIQSVFWGRSQTHQRSIKRRIRIQRYRRIPNQEINSFTINSR